ncbi:MAG: phosphoadenosine phosphosulfate reductase family protein [Bacillota bacterium]|jgi:phosphoadenosine phosphosulfate reductase
MYKVQWTEGGNLIRIGTDINDQNEIVPPRPVFTDELRMFGFDAVTSLPKSNVPVCWAIDKKYFYNGINIAVAKGGNIYVDPDIEFLENNIPAKMVPIDIERLLKTNAESIFSLENEAIDFIKNSFELYSKKVNSFVVAFSGGKDSQVILDLVSRVIPVEEYMTVFTDTGMELPCTQNTIKETEMYYRNKYPQFILHHAKSDKNVIDMWNSYGPPSRVNRWCCSVLKTALFGRKMKELLSTTKQPKVVVFEGVRSDESSRREAYNRIGEGVKHINIVNCRPIFKWNTTEVFLYLFSRGIHINPGYSMGLTRAGCSVCPFASDWSEFVIRKKYPLLAKQYTDVIENMARNIGIKSQERIDHYISSGNWKKNAGGKGLIFDSSRIDIISREPNFECVVLNPKTEWRTWFRTLMREAPLFYPIGVNKYSGEFKYDDQIVKFEVEEFNSTIHFRAFRTTNKILLISHLSKTFTKTAYCEKCGVCEVECPTGALRVRNKVTLDESMCVHCHNCFNINTKGCIIATRRQMYEGGKVMGGTAVKTSGIDKYSTFGIRDTFDNPWMTNFFSNMDNWFMGYSGLGPKQIPAMLAWMREAELVTEKEKKVSDLAILLKPEFFSHPSLVWQIIWTNLSFNSAIANWYTNNIHVGIIYDRAGLLENLKEEYPHLNETTLGNPIAALLNTFASTPLGGTATDITESDDNLRIGILTKSGNAIKAIQKVGTNRISAVTIAYLLYKNAEENDAYEVTVSDFYERNMHGVYNVFGLPAEAFISALRALMNMGVLTVDLLGGLDNIHLNRGFSSYQVLRDLLSRMK